MDKHKILASARFIASSNLNPHVQRVEVLLDEARGHVSISYFVDREPTDDDWDECELTCAELIGSYPALRTADTQCVVIGEIDADRDDDDAVVYRRQA